MADQLLHPRFRRTSLDRLKAATRSPASAGRKKAPVMLASTVFGQIVYGADHPYTREQTEASIGAITRDDLVAFC